MSNSDQTLLLIKRLKCQYSWIYPLESRILESNSASISCPPEKVVLFTFLPRFLINSSCISRLSGVTNSSRSPRTNIISVCENFPRASSKIMSWAKPPAQSTSRLTSPVHLLAQRVAVAAPCENPSTLIDGISLYSESSLSIKRSR